MHRGQWGKICSEGFDGIDAAVFCKSMGLIGGSARYTDGLKPTWGATSIQHMYEDKLSARIFRKFERKVRRRRMICALIQNRPRILVAAKHASPRCCHGCSDLSRTLP